MVHQRLILSALFLKYAYKSNLKKMTIFQHGDYQMSTPPLTVNITIYHRRRQLDPLVLGSWGADLDRRIRERILGNSLTRSANIQNATISMGVLKYYARKCMEELVVFPEIDFLAYINSLPLALPTFFTPLIYFGGQRKYIVSLSSIAAIGEGIAGFLAENVFDIILLCRPIGRSPDLLGINRSGVYYFIEAKATTTKSNIRDLLKNAVETIVEIIKSEISAGYASHGKIAGLAVVTYLESITNFESYVIELLT